MSQLCSACAAHPREAACPERELLLAALERNGWVLQRTARGLPVALNTLKRRMARHGIPRRRPAD